VAGAGLFFDLGSHQLDLLDFLLGPLDLVHGQAANLAGLYPAEDLVTAQFRWQAGALGTAVWYFCGPPGQHRDRLEILGSQGRICCSSFGFTPVVLEMPDGRQELPFPAPAHVQLDLIQTVVDQLLGRGTCPSTGVSALRTSRVLERIVEGYYAAGARSATAAGADGGASGESAFALGR